MTLESESPETVRAWDRSSIDDYGLPGVVLMENAGAGAARIIAGFHTLAPKRYPAPVIILCGPGNNGGDGYVVARHLDNAGIDVEVWLAFDRASLAPSSDAAVHLAVIERSGLKIHATAPPHGPPQNFGAETITIVDALLGTGLSRPLRAPFDAWVDAASHCEAPVFALDVPTGLDAGSGEVLGSCLRADHTITFAAAKHGLYREQGPAMTGKVHVVDIGMPRRVREPDET